MNPTSNRTVPVNLRQSGAPRVDMLIGTRVRKSPFWHKSVQHGARSVTVYNRMYHPRLYFSQDEGGLLGEYDYLKRHVTLWNVAVERQIQIKGPDATAFVDFLVTRAMTGDKELSTGKARYVILCNRDGGIVNDPVLLRIAEDEYWLSISDSDLALWAQGVNVDGRFDATVRELDVAPVQLQGPDSASVLRDAGVADVKTMKFFNLRETTLFGCDVVISKTGFSGEAGFEIYVREATTNGEAVWNPVLDAVKDHGGAAAPVNGRRRIAAGILSLGQDMDHETSPFQVNLGYQVPDDKDAEYVGKAELERQKEAIEDGEYPFTHKLVGLKMAGDPILEWASDFWLVSDPETGEECGYLTSAGWNPELEANLGLGFVPAEKLQAATDVPLDDSVYDADIDLEFEVHLPDEYAETPGEPVYATVAKVPFKQSANPSAREQAKIHTGEDA